MLGNIKRWAVSALLWGLIVQAGTVAWAQGAGKPEFEVLLSPEKAAARVNGRLFVFLSQKDQPEPRFGPNWFRPEPFFARNVRDFAPGESRTLDDADDGFPEPLSKLPRGKYYVQAILDHDFYQSHHAHGEGNFYSSVATWEHDPARPTVLKLELDEIVPAEPFPRLPHIKELVFKSDLLTKFHGRDVLDRAAVILPPSYQDQPDRRYPVLYIIPGFGDSHAAALAYTQPPPAEEGEVEMIRVILSGQCKWGHHVYADSATNGPRAESLIKELIPHVDRLYRTVADPTARFLSGHSSGGWSSLWLQVTHPDVFGGVWSTAPDPVDFRDWQQVNLYADPPLSLYHDEAGERRPIARRGTAPVLWYHSFCKMDDVLGRGGQMRSFEAVFSPLDDDKQPRRMWDRKTGRVDPAVAKEWQKYDIRLKLQNNWPELGPKLAGKLHIFTGEIDTFYLEGAVARLAETLRELGSDAEVKIVSGADHRTLLTKDLNRQLRRQMAEAYRKHHPEGK